MRWANLADLTDPAQMAVSVPKTKAPAWSKTRVRSVTSGQPLAPTQGRAKILIMHELNHTATPSRVYMDAGMPLPQKGHGPIFYDELA
jgi:hypothetical protein